MDYVIRKEQAARRTRRDIAYQDVLPEQKLIDLRALWSARLDTAKTEEYAEQCRKMIRLYQTRIDRLGVTKNAPTDSTAV
jgi:hypothetical protein